MPSPNNQMSVAADATGRATLTEAVLAAVVAPSSRRATPNSAHSSAVGAGVLGMPDPLRRGLVTVVSAARLGAPTAMAAAGAEFCLRDEAGRCRAFDPDRGPAEGPAAELEPDSALGPAVSACATACAEAIAVPTPTATATAPTRPREPLMRSEPVDEPIRSPLSRMFASCALERTARRLEAEATDGLLRGIPQAGAQPGG